MSPAEERKRGNGSSGGPMVAWEGGPLLRLVSKWDERGARPLGLRRPWAMAAGAGCYAGIEIAGGEAQRCQSLWSLRASRVARVSFRMIFPAWLTILPATSRKRRRNVVA